MKSSPIDTALERLALDWRSLYEDLRAYALDGGAFGNLSVALDVFLRQGMTAWMRVWSTAGNSERPVAPADTLAASIAKHGPIVELLSDMIFSRLESI
jgi:hypothetical protein